MQYNSITQARTISIIPLCVFLLNIMCSSFHMNVLAHVESPFSFLLCRDMLAFFFSFFRLCVLCEGANNLFYIKNDADLFCSGGTIFSHFCNISPHHSKDIFHIWPRSNNMRKNISQYCHIIQYVMKNEIYLNLLAE